MKNRILLVSIVIFISALSNLIYGQVSIGKEIISSESVSLEFGAEDRGLILPWVQSENAVVGVVPGTIIFDTNDKKVKVKLTKNWKSLSLNTVGIVNTILQDSETEMESAKVIIGYRDSNDATPGILILSDNNKAMILPKVESPHQNIVKPEPGTIVFDTKTQNLAVFNGAYWEFWN